MNVLLFAPALGVLLLRNTGVWRTIAGVALCVVVQALLGAPFLAAYPTSYLSRAFELSRVFFHTWTVNWKFLPPDIFTSKPLALALLAGHLSTLLLLTHCVWLADANGLPAFLVRLQLAPSALQCNFNKAGLKQEQLKPALRRKARHSSETVTATPGSNSAGASPLETNSSITASKSIPWGAAGWRDSPSTIAYTLLSCNFVGIVFARTLHYQFYSWYFHALPLLLWGATDLPLVLKVATLLGIEYAFNVGDAAGAATPFSSAVLQQAHWLMLAGIIAAGFSRRALPASGKRAD